MRMEQRDGQWRAVLSATSSCAMGSPVFSTSENVTVLTRSTGSVKASPAQMSGRLVGPTAAAALRQSNRGNTYGEHPIGDGWVDERPGSRGPSDGRRQAHCLKVVEE